MLFFAIGLDEERIKKDNLIDLEKAYKCIDDSFMQEEVTLYDISDGVRFYTRNIDQDDFSCLWIVNGWFKKVSWFQYYIKVWRFIDMDMETQEIYEDEDLFEHWVHRPEKP